MTAKTLSITQALAELQEAVKESGHVSACKVEFGMWDFSDKPYVQLYVACTLYGEYRHTNVKADSFYEALDQIRQWYRKVSEVTYVMETGYAAGMESNGLAVTAVLAVAG